MSGSEQAAAEWAEAVRIARDKRDAFLALANGDADDRGLSGREFFTALADVFRLYSSQNNWADPGVVLDENGCPAMRYHGVAHEFPADLAHTAGGLFAYIGSGSLPQPISNALNKRGAPAINPSEERDIRIAVAYIAAVQAREVDDRSPIKTITDLYGVAQRTVHFWKRDYEDTDRHSVIGNVVGLPLAIEAAGARYRAGSRSLNAINKRGVKHKQ